MLISVARHDFSNARARCGALAAFIFGNTNDQLGNLTQPAATRAYHPEFGPMQSTNRSGTSPDLRILEDHGLKLRTGTLIRDR
jgi:hypothetical protein